VKKATLTRFVTDLRSVVSDGVIQRQMIERVYAHIANGSAAQNQVSDFYRSDPPQTRARTQIVSVDVVAAFAPSPTTYEIEWIETTRDPYGKVLSEVRWRGNFTTNESRPADISVVSSNPLGIYVTNVAWSRVNR
jgi:type IV secretion system protein VirB5